MEKGKEEKSLKETLEKYSVPVLFAGITLPAVIMITPFAASLVMGKNGRKKAAKIVKKIIG